MFDFKAGLDVNPIQMGPQFMVAWEEDAEEQIRDLCWDVADHEGTHLICSGVLCDYLHEAGFPNYYELPTNLRKIIDEELEIF